MEASEQLDQSDYLSASSILVFHPGSKYLRIGRASDPFAQTVIQCLARKRKSTAPGKPHRDSVLVPRVKLNAERYQAIEDCRHQVSQMLQKSFQSSGAKRYAVPSKHVADLNAKIKPQKIPGITDEWPDFGREVIYGSDALKLRQGSNYNIHFPFRRGELNLHMGVGGSQSSALVDLEAIWSHAVINLLRISPSELSTYRAVLIIPALYNRSLIKHYLTILLTNMGFGGAIVLQDHVAATFGAGLGYACVVDIGDQKTSVSCVEDGISHPESRINLDYGGSDITQVLYYLLRKVTFPYKSCNPEESNFDVELLQKLKEENCHLDLDKCGMIQKEFEVRHPGKSHEKYSIYFGDDLLIAPCGLFHTELFQLTALSKSSYRIMGENQGDPEDPHDNTYLDLTSRKYTKAGANADGTDNADSQQPEDDLEIVNDVVEGPLSKSRQANGDLLSNTLLSLDQAIMRSIESCPTEDIKRKMYSCVLLVGGSSKFKGMDKYLLSRLALQIPFQYRSDPMEVIVEAKDISSSMTTWKGAAILACLESAQDLWIKREDWAKHGQKLLREKAPFPWT